MSRSREDRNGGAADRARDELFSHIHRCGVLRASHDQQVAWMGETIDYIAECYPALAPEELGELRAIGLRFCSPVIRNVQASETPADGEEERAASEPAAA